MRNANMELRKWEVEAKIRGSRNDVEDDEAHIIMTLKKGTS
jgi:hypothetical protein